MADYSWFNGRETPRFRPDEVGTKYRWNNLVNVATDATGNDARTELLAREAWALEARVHDLENVVAKLSEYLYNRPANIPDGQIYVGDVPPPAQLTGPVMTATTTTMTIPRNPADVARIADLESQVISLTQDYEDAVSELEEANDRVELLESRIANARDYLDD